MSLTPGTRLGAYEIVAAIGAGGTGEVYLAEDRRLGRRVALKGLSSSALADVDRLHRFEQEARAASALNHPNILTIYEIGSAGAIRFDSRRTGCPGGVAGQHSMIEPSSRLECRQNILSPGSLRAADRPAMITRS
jgi:serine/threonine protein kinase